MKLTEREREVCRWLVLGKTNKEVAEIMNIGIRTVESYRANIFDKLRVRNTVELVRKVYHIGESEAAE